MFILAAVIYVVCTAFYTVFASSEVQEWNEIPENNNEDDGKVKPESPKLKEIKREFQNLAFELEDSAEKEQQR